MPKVEVNKKQLWVAYNHMPGGHIVVQHFETVTRTKKVGDQHTEITFTAETQVEGFKKSDFVACKLKGSDLKKNHLLIFPANMDLNPKDPAGTVIEWAKAQGMEPIVSNADQAKAAQQVQAQAPDPKVAVLELDVLNLTEKVNGLDSKMDQILKALAPKTEATNAS